MSDKNDIRESSISDQKTAPAQLKVAASLTDRLGLATALGIGVFGKLTVEVAPS